MTAGCIIAATDLSSRSDRAIDRAVQLGLQSGRRVKVVHVISPEVSAAQDIDCTEAKVRSTFSDPDADVEILLVQGSPPKAIAQAAQSAEAALIVAGPARFNQLGDYFLGTAIDYLIRHSRIPVLVVKQRPHRPYERMLVPSDFSVPSENALKTAAQLFPEASIDLVHAFHVPFEGFQKSDVAKEQSREQSEYELKQFLSGFDLPKAVQGHLGYGGTEKVVMDALDELDPDLVVLGTHGSSRFRHATLGSTANLLLDRVHPDTLVVPPQD